MLTIRPLLVGLAVVIAIVAMAPVAQAQGPDLSGSVTINEPNGFGTACTAPCYTITKNFEVWFENNPGNPLPLVGNNTYIYKLTYTGGSGPGFPAVVGFEIVADTTFVTDAGALAGPGVAPSATTIGTNIIRWDFLAPAITFNSTTMTGDMSQELYIHSPLLPGTVNDNLASVLGQAAIDAPTTCVGPLIEANGEVPGEPMACTIGFWKNRAAGKQGVLQFFPDSDPVASFTAVVNQAVTLCAPVFADATDLLTNLQSKGKRSVLIRAKQQLAAFCLDLAAGDLLPDGQKCKLFEGNIIGDNACGMNITIGDALIQVLANIQSPDSALHHDAQECSDDINNGISVLMSAP